LLRGLALMRPGREGRPPVMLLLLLVVSLPVLLFAC
jgi:hypothetical protein